MGLRRINFQKGQLGDSEATEADSFNGAKHDGEKSMLLLYKNPKIGRK